MSEANFTPEQIGDIVAALKEVAHIPSQEVTNQALDWVRIRAERIHGFTILYFRVVDGRLQMIYTIYNDVRYTADSKLPDWFTSVERHATSYRHPPSRYTAPPPVAAGGGEATTAPSPAARGRPPPPSYAPSSISLKELIEWYNHSIKKLENDAIKLLETAVFKYGEHTVASPHWSERYMNEFVGCVYVCIFYATTLGDVTRTVIMPSDDLAKVKLEVYSNQSCILETDIDLPTYDDKPLFILSQGGWTGAGGVAPVEW